MPRNPTACGRLALVLVCLLAVPGAAGGAVLREARIDVDFTSARHCEVTATFTVEVNAASEIEHRLQVLETATVRLAEPEGGVDVAPAAAVPPRTLRVALSGAGGHVYTLRYQVVQGAGGEYRCPIFLPTTPTDGRSQDVTIAVTLPDGAEAGGGSLPAFAWDGQHGRARVGHVPAFVRVPFRAPGEPRGVSGLNVTRLMDTVAIVVLAGATVVFAWRRRRR